MMQWISQPWISFLAINWKAVGIITLCVLAAALALALWGACVWAGWNVLRKKQEVIFPLHIASRSNLKIRYQIRIELGNLQKVVKAFWVQENQQLPETTLKHYSYIQEAIPQKAIPARNTPSIKTITGSKEKKKAAQGIKKVSVVASLVASISGVLAGVLPGVVKAPFREINATIREQQQKVAAAKAEANHLQSTTRSLDHDVKHLGEAAGVKPGAGKNGGVSAAQTAQTPYEEIGQRLVVTEIPVTETAIFEPGESDICQLVIRPKNPLRDLAGAFQVLTQPVEIKEFPIYGEMPIRTVSADVTIKSTNQHRVLFASLVIGAGALCAWGSSELISWLLLFRS